MTAYEDYELSDLLPDLLGEVESLKVQFSQSGTYEAMLEEANAIKDTINRIITTLNGSISPSCESCAVPLGESNICFRCSDYSRWRKE